MPSLDDVLNKLRAVIIDLSSIDLWPPWDAAQTVVNAVGEAVAIASTPPRRTPTPSGTPSPTGPCWEEAPGADRTRWPSSARA